jgi:outer membrane protein assembly factor BamB
MVRHITGSILLVIVITTSGCLFNGFFPRKEIRVGKNLTDFTLEGKNIYFGAGYNLYRLDLLNRSVERIFRTNLIHVEQPLIADGVIYFGGNGRVDSKGAFGDRDSFFAVDLRGGEILWKFPLGHDGYGTFGTFPVLAGERILVCARQHLHCLDRRSGRELWKLDNWLGADSDGISIPYVHNGFVYYKIGEEFFTKNDANDGHWAVVSLETGERVGVINAAEQPGTYEDSRGNGIGVSADGVVYGATRYDRFPASRFGALDLDGRKILWEVQGSTNSRMRPAVNDKYVFTTGHDSIQALDRKTGKVAWSVPVVDIAEFGINRSADRIKWDFENEYSRKFAATSEVVITRGSQGIVASKAHTGKTLWLVKIASDQGDAAPLIVEQMVLVSSAKDCSIVAFDLKTGNELWRINVPDCTYYTILDD